MDAAQYDSKLVAAALLLAGAPDSAARKVAGAVRKMAAASAPKSGTPPPLGARLWFEVQSRIDAARKVVQDAAAKWRDDLDAAAKEQIRKAVRTVEDAIEGARDAARAAGSAAAQTWDDLKKKADDVAGTIGIGLGAAAGMTGLLMLGALFLVLASVSGRARPREFRSFTRSRALPRGVEQRRRRSPRAPEARPRGRSEDPACDLGERIATRAHGGREIREQPRERALTKAKRRELKARDGDADDCARFRFDLGGGLRQFRERDGALVGFQHPPPARRLAEFDPERARVTVARGRALGDGPARVRLFADARDFRA
jgi:ElaB/YqjD/DUF883 family membrane-anchored ribosome-binding protein